MTSNRNITVFLGNVWDELLSERGLRLLEARYGQVRGNWLRGPRHATQPGPGDVVVLAPSTLGSALTPDGWPSETRGILPWLLFPDQMLGWDFAEHKYLYRPHSLLESLTATGSPKLLVNSGFTATVLRRSGLTVPTRLVPPAVDIHGIADHADPVRAARDGDRSHIMWSHMWRTQKAPETALWIIDAVLDRCPSVRVSIGRSYSWADEEHSPPEFRERLKAHLMALSIRHQGRVSLVHRFNDPNEYWRFLGSVDVSFSCAHEESFGVAMMEHAAAGVACVNPRTLCYPELHTGAVLTAPTLDALAGAVCALATEPERRRVVAASGREQASRFAPQPVIAALGAEIDRLITG